MQLMFNAHTISLNLNITHLRQNAKCVYILIEKKINPTLPVDSCGISMQVFLFFKITSLKIMKVCV